MNNGTWVWYTMAGWLTAFGVFFVVTTMRQRSVVSARRHGSPAAGMFALAAGGLVFATLGKVEVGENSAEFSLVLDTFATIVFCAVVLAFTAGMSLVGVAWAEDISARVPKKHVRMMLGVVVPLAVVLLGLISFWATRNDLPDELASHFGDSGADDSMTVGDFALFTSMLAGVGVAMLVGLAAMRRSLQAQLAPLLGFLGGFLAGLGSGIFAFTVVSQSGLADWRDASAGPVVLGSLAAAVLCGAAAAWLATMLPTLAVEVPSSAQRPTMDLSPGQNAVWSTTLHSRVLEMSSLAILLAAAFIVAARGWTWWVVPMMGFSFLATLTLSRLRVRADGHGLHVNYGFLPWPSTTVPVDRIDTASVIDVRPMEWGGWGYRGSLKLMRQAAVVHRAGPGIRLDLQDGKVFVVTVDNPETPVALLNAEVARV